MDFVLYTLMHSNKISPLYRSFILADEMSDITSKEQPILVVCFYEDHQEQFLCFDTVNDLTCVGLAKRIISLYLEPRIRHEPLSWAWL